MWLFYYFNFESNYTVLKSKSPCILLKKNTNFNKNETESRMENPIFPHLERQTWCFSSYKNRKAKINCDELELAKKKRPFFFTVYFIPRKFCFSSALLLLKTSFQFTNEISRCIHTGSLFL